MSFQRQQQRQKQEKRQRRGFYVTRACTNWQEKHAKCSGGAICERCTLRNLECTFIDSGHSSTLSLFGYPQQQPDDATLHSEFYGSEQVYILNNFENDFDGTSMLYSMSPNPVQGHASTLSLSGYPPQQSDNVTLYSDYYEKKTAYAYQEVDPFSYQPCTNTGYIMQNDKNFIDNTSINNNTVYFNSENKHP
ncbi:hypothetical protein F8M41_002776 [Gigaspora margarita]|uniref:Zn(2)-C6 fungal-type domain-containing protein n=1 Tax=Gigaspora margarita TaxID=4874 RepID=A0A8H3XD17_GIGMA|nr:hypothetical protein F8M41_002776 [Gigaspora margarita]